MFNRDWSSDVCSSDLLICQLPEAYRRLSRPSSPVIAKASTICTYSLDPITLKPEPFLNSDFVAHETPAIGFLKQLFLYSKVVEYKMVYFTYIYFKNFRPGNSCEQNVFRFCNQSILLKIILPIWIYQIITICISSLLLPFC